MDSKGVMTWLNKIFLYSRDESKHWKMNIDFCNHPNINFLIGDIRNNEKISETLLRINPNSFVSSYKYITFFS